MTQPRDHESGRAAVGTSLEKPRLSSLGRAASRRARSRRGAWCKALGWSSIALTVGLTVGVVAYDRLSAGRGHGQAHLFFPPWIDGSDAVARIDRAGGVPIASPGAPSGRSGFFRAIAAEPEFAGRARAEGALLVIFSPF